MTSTPYGDLTRSGARLKICFNVELNPLTLALDCATSQLLLCVFQNQKILGLTQIKEGQHSQILLPEIEKLFQKIKIKPDQITEILYAAGPGSFTSIRIGYATLLGLFGFQKNPPKYLQCSSLLLRCYSLFYPPGIAIIRAGRQKFYVGTLSEKGFDEKIMMEEEFDKWLQTNPNTTVNRHETDTVTAEAFLKIYEMKKFTEKNLIQTELNYAQSPV